MEGLFRRPSGIYFARLAVPVRLRAVVGQTELIGSTGVRDLSLARIVGGELLTQWRKRLRDLERLQLNMNLDLEQLTVGSPVLASGTGTLPIAQAAAASGLSAEALLREAVDGRLALFVRLSNCRGALVRYEDLHRNPDGGWDVPQPAFMPSGAIETLFTGVVQIIDAREVAAQLLAGDVPEHVLFGQPGDKLTAFAPDDPQPLGVAATEVLAREVEALRRNLASMVTLDQIEVARARRATPVPAVDERRLRRLADSVELYLQDHERPRGDEQTRRIRGACRLFLELMGADLRGIDLTRDEVRRFRDEVLPTLPAKENKVRLIHKTTSISESIAAVAATDWPRLSPDQCVKTMGWIGGWIEWLGRESWCEAGLAAGLTRGGQAGRAASTKRKKTQDQDRRDPFTDTELTAIFDAPWFRKGRGELTTAGTYRTWSPAKTWLPLIGLLTGARIGEIAQLQLSDIWRNEHGVWLFDVIDGSDGDADGNISRKKLKNVNARRQIPVHSELLRIGLIEWRDDLRAAGFRRLFPELKYDPEKGYGKAMTKWFSAYLAGLGMPRNGRKVFHSFRHTMATRLSNDMVAPLEVVKQILGHERGQSTTVNTYRKDMVATGPDSPLVQQIEAVTFPFLRALAPLDRRAGLQAVRDALRRKTSGRGGEED